MIPLSTSVKMHWETSNLMSIFFRVREQKNAGSGLRFHFWSRPNCIREHCCNKQNANSAFNDNLMGNANYSFGTSKFVANTKSDTWSNKILKLCPKNRYHWGERAHLDTPQTESNLMFCALQTMMNLSPRHKPPPPPLLLPFERRKPLKWKIFFLLWLQAVMIIHQVLLVE